MKILKSLGLEKCRMGFQIQTSIKEDDEFIIPYIENEFSKSFTKDIIKKKDLLKKDVFGEFDLYTSEIFVFSRKELQKLIDHIIENR